MRLRNILILSLNLVPAVCFAHEGETLTNFLHQITSAHHAYGGLLLVFSVVAVAKLVLHTQQRAEKIRQRK